MRLARRLVGLILGVLGATGTTLCVAGLVGVWVVHADLTRRADGAFGRVEDRLGPAKADIGRAAERLRQAHREVEAVERKEEEPAAPPAAKRRRAVVPKATAASAAGQLGQARQALVTATEVGLVADGILDVLAELPASERVGLDTDRLRDTSAQLTDLIRTAERLSAALPAQDDESDPGIAEPLGRAVAALDAAEANFGEVHARVQDWHRRTVRALTTGAVVLTALLVWVGLGQVCLTATGFRRPRTA